MLDDPAVFQILLQVRAHVAPFAKLRTCEVTFGERLLDLYLEDDPERTVDSTQSADILEPSNIEPLNQPLFLLGHGVENSVDCIRGDEEFLHVVELPTENPFGEPVSRWSE